jgi:hypothetical protein
MPDALVQGRQVFVYRWGVNRDLWDEPPTAVEALASLREWAGELRLVDGGWGIGSGARRPNGTKQVRVGDVLLFYAGVKFGNARGVYALAEAGAKTGSGLVITRDKNGVWRLPFRWLPASRTLAKQPLTGHADLFGPSGPASTLLRLTKIPSAVRKLVEAALRGERSPAADQRVGAVSAAERKKLAAPLKRLREIPAAEREIVRREIWQVVRNALFRSAVLGLWFADGRDAGCAVCELNLTSDTGLFECEVAHVVEKWAQGREQIRNGLPLCRTHHWAFDKHLWGIHPDTLKVVVRRKWRRSPMLRDLHGVTIARPDAPPGVEPLARKELKQRWRVFKSHGE